MPVGKGEKPVLSARREWSASPTAAGRSSILIGLLTIIQWIAEQRVNDDLKKQRGELMDTFLLLMVLEAFGSLIFLTKGFIDQDQTTTFAACIFRPVFGIFLAMAMFVFDMPAHSIVSTFSALQVRHETLCILALASGILADQAYTIVSRRAQSILSKMRENTNGESSDGPPTA
jgi:hypothetical protein